MDFNLLSFAAWPGRLLKIALVPGLALSLFAAGPSLAQGDYDQEATAPPTLIIKTVQPVRRPAALTAAAPPPGATSPFDPNAKAPGSGLAIINDTGDRAKPAGDAGAVLETASGAADEPVERVAEPAVTAAAQEPVTEPPATPPADGWAVKKIERPLAAMRQKSDEKQTPNSNKRRPAEPLKNIRLTLADGKGLGAAPAKAGSAKFRKSCREKKSGSLVFCIVNLRWPKKIAALFVTNTVLYTGTKTIVRYDEGMATHYHTLFPTKSFAAIVDYFTAKYGPPTQTTERSIAPLASPRMANPTVIWRSTAPLTGALTTLEVRTFDDARGGFPDTRRGAVLLYQQWSKPIFPYISTIELMMLSAKGQD